MISFGDEINNNEIPEHILEEKKEEALPLIGTMPDSMLAEEIGVAVSTVYNWRIKAGIKSYQMQVRDGERFGSKTKRQTILNKQWQKNRRLQRWIFRWFCPWSISHEKPRMKKDRLNNHLKVMREKLS